MNTGVKNTKPPGSLVYLATARLKVITEGLFASVLGSIKGVMLMLDLLLLTACLCFSGVMLMGQELTFSEYYLSGMLYFNLLWVFLSYLRGIHKHLLLIDAVAIFRILGKVFFVFVVCSWVFILILLDGFNHMNDFLSFVSVFYLLFGGVLIANRILLLSIRKHYKDKIRKKKNIFIIGDSSSCELLGSYIEENQCDLRLIGYFNNGYRSTRPAEFEVDNAVYQGKRSALDLYVYGEKCRTENRTGVDLGTDADADADVLSDKKPVQARKFATRRPSWQRRYSKSGMGHVQRKGSEKVIRGRIADCVHYFGVMDIDEIYCSLQSMEEETARYLIMEADKHMIRIKFLPDFYQILRRRSTINYLGTVPVLSIREEPLAVDSNHIMKRIFDFCFALFVLVFILSWLTVIIGILIKLESDGPVFFKQERSGMNNRPFEVYKFRSMRQVKGTQEETQAVRGDVRLTKVGAFLRRTSLDELPQFINVLLGTMSVVGPRPHMLSHTDRFSKEVETYMVRHFAKQGITGWAQVNGCRGETRTKEAIEQRVLHDVWYIENWSLTLDLKIIFLTVWNIFRGEENAY